MTTRSTRSSFDTRAVSTPAVATASPRLPFQQQKPKRQLVAPSPDAATPGKLPRTTAANRTARPIVFGSPVQPKLGPGRRRWWWRGRRREKAAQVRHVHGRQGASVQLLEE